MTELGLQNNSCVKIGSDVTHTKHFQKVQKKFKIPMEESIQVAITDSTFIGLYWLVITDRIQKI